MDGQPAPRAEAPQQQAPRADLVIGLGNPLRGDDGVGGWLAERAARPQPPSPHSPADPASSDAGRQAGIRVRIVQQLTPELADDLLQAGRVLFIDAWWPPGYGTGLAPFPEATRIGRDATGAPPGEERADTARRGEAIAARPGRPWLCPLAPADGRGTDAGFSHQLDPSQLLAITALLYGRVPDAWQLLVPAFAMPHGVGFSAALQGQLPLAEQLLRQWCDATTALGRPGGASSSPPGSPGGRAGSGRGGPLRRHA